MRKKMLSKVVITIIAVILVLVLIKIISSGMDKPMPEAENKYLNDVLSEINSNSSREEVIKLLGEPSRDMDLKVNWWVTLNGQKSRVGVYFSASDKKATEISFDGGMGRFYYRKDLRK